MIDKTLYLFVPATRLDRVSKAVASGADTIIIDLEDTVSEHQKHEVRQSLIEFDATFSHSYWLRINACYCPDYSLDLACIKNLNKLQGVVLPKCQNATQIEDLYQQVQKPIIAVIECVLGVTHIPHIAKAQGVYAMSFGCLDLMQSMGIRLGSHAAHVMFDKIRSDLLIHSLLNHIQRPIETIFADFKDEQGLKSCVRHWVDFGFSGQFMIHPKQIEIARSVLQVNEQDVIFAEAIMQQYRQTGNTVFSVNGKMIDLPLIVWAKEVLGV